MQTKELDSCFGFTPVIELLKGMHMAVLLAITLFTLCFLGLMAFTCFCEWIMKRQEITS